MKRNINKWIQIKPSKSFKFSILINYYPLTKLEIVGKKALSYYKFTSYIKTRIQCHTSRYLIVRQTNHKTHNDYCLLAANMVAAINISEGHRHIVAQIINTLAEVSFMSYVAAGPFFYCIVDPLEKVNILTQVLSKCKWKIKCTVCDVKYSSFRRSWRIVYIVICRSLIISCIYILQQYLRGLNHYTPFCLPFYNRTWGSTLYVVVDCVGVSCLVPMLL